MNSAINNTNELTNISRLKDSNDIEKELPTDDRFYSLLGFFVVFFLFGGFALWSIFVPLDSASIALGRVSVESHRKVVQHLEGGIISKILVKDGDKVKDGDVLIVLDDVQFSSELEIVKSRYYLALAQRARLLAEQQSAAKIDFPEELLALSSNKDIAEIIKGQEILFQARKKSLESEIQVYEQRIIQLKEQISGLELVINNQNRLLNSYKEEISEWRKLYEKQMIDKIRLREAERKVEELMASIASNMSNISKSKEQIIETQEQIVFRKRKFQEEVLTSLKEVDAIILDAKARISYLEDRLRRTEIRAPASGVVFGLRYTNPGAVIKPGDVLMEIVPEDEKLIVEANILPTDIDRVYPGLEADIRFSAFNIRKIDVVKGTVKSVSADALNDPRTGFTYYLAKIEISDAGLRYLKENNLTLQPGMPAEVFILTGKRTFLEYLTKSFTDRFSRAFKEE